MNAVVFTPLSDLFVVEANVLTNGGSDGAGCDGGLGAGVEDNGERCGVDVGVEGIRYDHSKIAIVATTTVAGNGGGVFFEKVAGDGERVESGGTVDFRNGVREALNEGFRRWGGGAGHGLAERRIVGKVSLGSVTVGTRC